jgi:hypothetical protein
MASGLPSAPHFVPAAILGMQRKDMLSEINANQGDLAHGRPLQEVTPPAKVKRRGSG